MQKLRFPSSKLFKRITFTYIENPTLDVGFGKAYGGEQKYKPPLLIEPPKISVSSFMGFLKSKSSLMVYEKRGNTKCKYRNREFWCRGYYIYIAGKNIKKIQEYIQNQLKEDCMKEQLTLDIQTPVCG